MLDDAGLYGAPLLLMPLAWPRLRLRAAVDAGILLAGIGVLFVLAMRVPESLVVSWVFGALPVETVGLALKPGLARSLLVETLTHCGASRRQRSPARNKV
ncbi:hypothetical protein [Elstera sp.]|uniref:hypothetical protein n=1 Tax=Elstera sp. TaxID=1916664 RepID=UPI0037C118EA